MAYDAYNLLGDVGGALGLLLGYSILSMYDGVMRLKRRFEKAMNMGRVSNGKDNKRGGIKEHI